MKTDNLIIALVTGVVAIGGIALLSQNTRLHNVKFTPGSYTTQPYVMTTEQKTQESSVEQKNESSSIQSEVQQSPQATVQQTATNEQEVSVNANEENRSINVEENMSTADTNESNESQAPQVVENEQPAPQEIEEKAKEIEAKIKEILQAENIEFETGKAILTPKGKEIVQKIADILKEYPDLKIEIAGHTDAVGNEQKNLKLSQKRAEAVKEALIEAGIAADRLVAKGYGESKPLAGETGESQANRRVEFHILK